MSGPGLVVALFVAGYVGGMPTAAATTTSRDDGVTTIFLGGPGGDAVRSDAVEAVQARVQQLVQTINPEDQQCLFLPAQMLAIVRAVGYAQEYMPDDEGNTGGVAIHETLTEMIIAGVGTYVGRKAIDEYNSINDGSLTDHLHDFLHRTLADIRVLESSETRPSISANVSVLSAWEQFSRVRATWQNNVYTFFPCSAVVQTWEVEFDVENGINMFMSSIYPNRKLCEQVQRDCTGPYEQFASVDECVDFYDRLPTSDPTCVDKESKKSYQLKGNTTACRFLHHFMADTSPQYHCFHAGRGLPDVDGNVKCGPCDNAAKKSLEGVNDAVPCTPRVQADVEMRLAALLPHCVEALSAHMCTAQCRRALSQFQMLGTGHEQIRHTSATCGCHQSMLSSPMSATFSELDLDPMSILTICMNASHFAGAGCPMAIGVAAAECATKGQYGSVKTGGCKDVTTGLVQQAPAVLRRISRLSQSTEYSRTVPRSDTVLAVDYHAMTELVRVASGKTDTGRMFVDSFGRRSGAVPFLYGGSVLMSYDSVVDAVSDPAQGRSKLAMTNQPKLANRLEGMGGLMQEDTGSPKHRCGRAMVWEAWPALRNKGLLELGPPPPELQAQLERSARDPAALRADLADPESSIAKDFLRYHMREFTEQLFPASLAHKPPHEPTPELEAAVAAAAYNIPALQADQEWHRMSMFMSIDLDLVARRKITAQWIKDYYGPTRMDELASLVSTTSSHDDVAELLAVVYVSVVGQVVEQLVRGVAERLFKEPCQQIPLFRESPYRYFVEHTRHRSPSPRVAMRWNTPMQQRLQPRQPNGNNTTVPVSIVDFFAANTDPTAFKDPAVFNPRRDDLMKTMSWNAVEGDIVAGNGPSMGRYCPGHDLSLRYAEAMMEQLLPNAAAYAHICVAGEILSAADVLRVAAAVACFFLIAWVLVIVYGCRRDAHIFRAGRTDSGGGLPSPVHTAATRWNMLRTVTALGVKHRTKKSRVPQQLSLTRIVRPAPTPAPAALHRCTNSARPAAAGDEALRHPSHEGDADGTVRVVDARFAVELPTGEIFEILKGVCAELRPGLTAIMGPSGSGKTTLLDLMAANLQGGMTSGKLFYGSVDGHTAYGEQYLRDHCGYVKQDGEPWDAQLSVRQNLIYAAELRLALSTEKLVERVDKVIEMLQMEAYQDTIVGMVGMPGGLSGGQKRKLAVSLQLLTDPPFLFLDEPTSGLDATASFHIFEVLRNIGEQGHTVVVTVHQPRVEIWNMIPNLLVLANGKVCFSGPPAVAERLFTAENAVNPADGMMDCFESKAGQIAAAKLYSEDDNSREMDRSLREFARAAEGLGGTARGRPMRRTPTHVARLLVVFRRFMRSSARSWISIVVVFAIQILLFGFLGFRNAIGPYEYLAGIFVVISVPPQVTNHNKCLPIIDAVALAWADIEDGAISRSHFLWVVALHMLAVEAVQALLACSIMLSAMGDFSTDQFIQFFAICWIGFTMLQMCYVGMLAVPRTTSEQHATSNRLVTVNSALTVLCGFLISPGQLKAGPGLWLLQISPTYHAMVLSTGELLDGRNFVCNFAEETVVGCGPNDIAEGARLLDGMGYLNADRDASLWALLGFYVAAVLVAVGTPFLTNWHIGRPHPMGWPDRDRHPDHADIKVDTPATGTAATARRPSAIAFPGSNDSENSLRYHADITAEEEAKYYDPVSRPRRPTGEWFTGKFKMATALLMRRLAAEHHVECHTHIVHADVEVENDAAAIAATGAAAPVATIGPAAGLADKPGYIVVGPGTDTHQFNTAV